MLLVRGKAQLTLLLVVTIFLATFEECYAVARLIRLPLQRTTTQNAGRQGQPVVNYFTTIQIGTPPKYFKVQFDLGTQYHFVPHYSWNPFNTNLHYGIGFQCKSSSTCIKNDRSFSIIYQWCGLTGKVYEDYISFTNVRANQLDRGINTSTAIFAPQAVTWRQNFLAISSASSGQFSSLPVDGYFGLAPTPQSSSSLKNILINLHEAKHIDNLQFSLWFNPVLDSPQGGELILGGVDPNRYQGEIFWHRLQISTSDWSLNLQHVTLGNQYVSCIGRPSKCRVRFSSGLSDIYGPRADVNQIYALLNTTQSNGMELIDCRRITQLPTITFTIDGIPYVLLPSNYIRKTVDGRIFKKETCYVAILPSADGGDEWILGTNFLGAYYSIYDITYRQIGFAALR